MTVILKALVLGAVGYGAVCTGMYFYQDRLIFLPDQRVDVTPSQFGLEYEDVYLPTAAGDTVHGWFVPAPQGRALALGTVLFLHGNAGNISHRPQTLRLLHGLGLSTLIIDYPGYGKSSGTASEGSAYAAATAAWQELTVRRAIAPRSVILFGRSLGGGVATELATKVEPGALILENTFTSVPDVAAAIYPYLPVRWLARTRFANLDRMHRIKCPLLITHARTDRTIPFAHSVRLFEIAAQPKRFMELAGGHNDAFIATGQSYGRGMKDFLLAASGVKPWTELDSVLLEQAPR